MKFTSGSRRQHHDRFGRVFRGAQAFTLKEDLCVGKAYALANDDYGPGGGTQYYITKKDRKNMKKRSIIDLTNP
jgi:hypothetical protein